MRAFAATFVVTVLVVLLGVVSVLGANAAATPSAGPIKVFITPGNGTSDKLVITGAIGDYGKAVTTDKNGKANPNGHYHRITLQHGTFIADTTALDAKTNTVRPTINNATCSFSFVGSGPVTISNGTGLYTGISGRLSMRVEFAVIGSRYTSGKKKGQCNMSNNAKPASQWGAVTGTGTVKYG